MKNRSGLISVLALFFLLLLTGILVIQLEGYRRQQRAFDSLISHYELKLQRDLHSKYR
ncbi:hypothetical protein FD04_GL002125 [Secundilactobacillus odoratitofui DSM 19909 = JCM 15043]|uniref:Uncharacterized protein n=1 Tax=Secundilactobacillus odoratitofui DSM 19909 = JCM 15043 TaxID=1423776 RepID=A0A0R1LNA7_9LACO|nr:hypothetical protein [Secundilactobacillus odoratitofui]KRK97263.1 hypothetical protein FD04_GL002125 [Secundilactobacillus odoratitofui DSM 19909 = JCM 15043]